jgi:hypothetical protein
VSVARRFYIMFYFMILSGFLWGGGGRYLRALSISSELNDSQSPEGVKYGHEYRGTRNQE